jgi:hypothetical protein
MAKLLLLIGLLKLLLRLDIKISFEQVEYRKPTLITSNTSGFIHFMSEGRSEDFQNIFL